MKMMKIGRKKEAVQRRVWRRHCVVALGAKGGAVPAIHQIRIILIIQLCSEW